jgi:hypothetical protein
MRTAAGCPVPLRATAVATLVVVLLAGLTACARENDEETVHDEATTPSATASTGDEATGSASGGPGTYPLFAPEDYVYRLEVICFCPQVGAVRVEVADGEVVSARTLRGGRGVTKGAEAPDFARLTINDVIEIANDPSASSVEVTWPDGQDYPSVVDVDRIERATDDEVTYTIKNVRVR